MEPDRPNPAGPASNPDRSAPPRLDRYPDPPRAGDERAPDKRDRPPGAVRSEDMEPYLALQHVSRFFKIAATLVAVALVIEAIASVAVDGAEAFFPLLNRLIQGIVLAAILWGVGDLTGLLIDAGHDVRAARILLGRISARQGPPAQPPRGPRKPGP